MVNFPKKWEVLTSSLKNTITWHNIKDKQDKTKHEMVYGITYFAISAKSFTFPLTSLIVSVSQHEYSNFKVNPGIQYCHKNILTWLNRTIHE